ncbi:hypothetical protein M404DRAFT_1005580 [Pisolithus tinctorius Marx 270]|uniref:Uncharacterized protein n=1 Tax=Pisolithus tinctorius Marx 270 TaxID=870435 RepID=A0A0C3JKD3_PISTI|nr:hypothetical protein M404DRAFT_1005580 [Pisolithus tinctorius Marx 270]
MMLVSEQRKSGISGPSVEFRLPVVNGSRTGSRLHLREVASMVCIDHMRGKADLALCGIRCVCLVCKVDNEFHGN